MNNLKISNQLFILVACVLLFVSCCFSIFTYSCVISAAESEVYSKLETYIILNERNNSLENLPDMKVDYFSIEPDIKKVNQQNNFLDENEILSIKDYALNSSFEARNGKPFSSIFINSKGEKIYYTFIFDNFTSGFTIAYTNSRFVDYRFKPLLLKIFFVFFIFAAISCCVVAYWSNRFVRRINRLQKHIINLPKDKYEVKYNDDSLDEIGDLTRSIEKMRLEICENEKTKQEMLQNISHDFKTPIAVIKSYAEAYQDGMADESSAKIIIAQADILKKKVNRLLQFNSLEYLKKDREFEQVNMNLLVEEVVENYKYQTQLEFDIEMDPDIYFTGYTDNYYTVVDNIIDNAKRYAKSKIMIILKNNRLRIYNDGEHIDEQFINTAFKPYEKGSKGEFGLGMSIVQRTVDFFGYDLVVVNENVGVSFIIEKKEGK